jgi:hypothetical protein
VPLPYRRSVRRRHWVPVAKTWTTGPEDQIYRDELPQNEGAEKTSRAFEVPDHSSRKSCRRGLTAYAWGHFSLKARTGVRCRKTRITIWSTSFTSGSKPCGIHQESKSCLSPPHRPLMTRDAPPLWRGDASCDGQFYIGVETTGIYCRPSCPARRPKRANVRFHETAAEAEAAGFRPCKRCKPDQPNLVEAARGESGRGLPPDRDGGG